MTLPLGMTILKGFMNNGSVSVVLAGVMLSVIPPLLIYHGQNKLIEGITLGKKMRKLILMNLKLYCT